METVVGNNDLGVRKFSSGSALILAVVLTSLLAVVGVLFVMTRRVDMVATSAISVDRDLNLAVDSVVARIEEELARDVDFVGEDLNHNGILDIVPPDDEDLNGNGVLDLAEYYDYPDERRRVAGADGILNNQDDRIIGDPWLASLEPYDTDNVLGSAYDYRWPRITDLYETELATGEVVGLLESFELDNWQDKTSFKDSVGAGALRPQIINPTEPVIGIELANGSAEREYGGPADADGDGVADSRWIRLPAMTASKGQPVYAAIRIIDNGGMVNVNTVYADLGGVDQRSGDMLTDIYINDFGGLNGLIKSGNDSEMQFLENRDSNVIDARTYYEQVAQRTGGPELSRHHVYTLYDMTEELSLRNRFILYENSMTSRLEADGRPVPPRLPCLYATLRAATYGNAYDPYTDLDKWEARFDPFFDDGNRPPVPVHNAYDFRHLLTTYSADRVINARPFVYGGQAWGYNRLVSVNRVTTEERRNRLYYALGACLAAGGVDDPNNDPNVAGQIVANIIDYKDVDMDIAVYKNPELEYPDTEYFGFERPCVYISELVYGIQENQIGYAIEFHNPHAKYNSPDVREEEFDWLRKDANDATTGLWLVIYSGHNGLGPLDVDEQLDWQGDPSFFYVKNDATGLITTGDPNSPEPPNDGRYVDPDVEFSWPDVDCANSYNVYWGEDFNDVNSATKDTPGDANRAFNVKASSDTNLPPDKLEINTTYYWRVDAADANGEVCERGEIWNFKTGKASGLPLQEFSFKSGSIIELRRRVKTLIKGGPDRFVVVDRVVVPPELVGAVGTGARSYERDITRHKCIRRLWMDPNSIISVSGERVGDKNTYVDAANTQMIPAYPYLDAGVYGVDVNEGGAAFKNTGELGMIFTRPTYYLPGADPVSQGVIGYPRPSETEDQVRINFADPNFQQLLNFITVFDPSSDGVNNDGDRFWDVENWLWPELIDEYDGQYKGKKATDPLLPGGIPDDGRPDPGDEVQIAGRININTAPWYVIAQLPWITVDVLDPMGRYALARAIVAYRDKVKVPFSAVDYSQDPRGRARGIWDPCDLMAVPQVWVREDRGFTSVAELMNVTHNLAPSAIAPYDPNHDIRRYARDGNDVDEFVDLTRSDGAVDDFEERDMILSRISNLVTVRSDVFTAYILVRLGLDGPQKRVIAILDRSGVYGPGDKVKVRALHPVPDPR
jgi:hypothetical protein